MTLRPENEFAFANSGINAHEHVLFLDDLPPPPLDSLVDLGLRYALVDHNRLSPRFGDKNDSVVALIDHHDDEGYHKSAHPRNIQVPTGSCSSLVTTFLYMHYFKEETVLADVSFPISLADLLIQAILIDTNNVKKAPKGKAVQTDIQAMAILVPLSSFAETQAVRKSVTARTVDFQAAQSSQDNNENDLEKRSEQLAAKKFDLSALGSRDLLRRDYKEYTSDIQHWRYGLSSVPVGLEDWLSRGEIGGSWECLLEKVDNWGQERRLDIVGVLTSYVRNNGSKRKEKRRELLFLLRGDQIILNTLQGIFPILEANKVLRTGALEMGEPVLEKNGINKWKNKIWMRQQENADATRKQVAPAVKTAMQIVEADY